MASFDQIETSAAKGDLGPSIYTPGRAADELRQLGVSEEHWQDFIDQGLFSHDIRTLLRIALGGNTVDIVEFSKELFSDEEHGPLRIENLRNDLNNENVS